jgi:hypothetical protein
VRVSPWRGVGALLWAGQPSCGHSCSPSGERLFPANIGHFANLSGPTVNQTAREFRSGIHLAPQEVQTNPSPETVLIVSGSYKRSDAEFEDHHPDLGIH